MKIATNKCALQLITVHYSLRRFLLPSIPTVEVSDTTTASFVFNCWRTKKIATKISGDAIKNEL